jgi:hypothetical protein
MSEPSSSVPGEIADAEVTQSDTGTTGTTEPTEPEEVHLDVDEAKLEAWDEVKSDYEVEPDGEPVPNSMDATKSVPDDQDEEDEEDE